MILGQRLPPSSLVVVERGDLAAFEAALDGDTLEALRPEAGAHLVRVDEARTEAAAATAVHFDAGAAFEDPPVRTRTLRLYRPFLVREPLTRAILFFGWVVSPRARGRRP